MNERYSKYRGFKELLTKEYELLLLLIIDLY